MKPDDIASAHLAFLDGEFDQALPVLASSASSGDPDSQFMLATMYEQGLGIPQDLVIAAELYRRASDLGSAEAQYSLALMIRSGSGISQDFAAAADRFRLAAQQGHPGAQLELSTMCFLGIGTKADEDEAITWLERSAEYDPEAQYRLGNLSYEWLADRREAATLYQKAAEQGHAGGQFKLGFLYLRGEGLERSSAQCETWYRIAAENGHAEAQVQLGRIYHEGWWRDPNYREAAKWYRLAADQGFAYGQHLLGLLHETGQGVPQDIETALRLFQKAAAKGWSAAQYRLGNLYQEGELVKRDHKHALRWYESAAVSHHGRARQALGRQPLPRHFDLIYSWFSQLEIIEIEDWVVQFDQTSELDGKAITFACRAKLNGDAITAPDRISEIYASGVDIPRNQVLAYMWWTIMHTGRAKTEPPSSTFDGMRKNEIREAEDKARQWMFEQNEYAKRIYREATEMNLAEAQRNLGLMYRDGPYFRKDPVLAFMWLRLAAMKGHEDADSWLSSTAKSMSPEQIAKAECMAEEWVKRFQQ